MKIAIITPNRLQSRLLINKLKKEGIKPTVIFYKNGNYLSHLKKRAKNYIKNILFYNRDDIRIQRIRKKNEKEGINKLINYGRKEEISTHFTGEFTITDDVNSSQTIDVLNKNKIELLFVWGVPILRKRLIESVPLVINAHSSILPEYRGSKSEFWQFHNQEFLHSGVTFHKVDTGVDTGDVFLQIHATSSDLKNPEFLHASNAIRVIDNFSGLLHLISNQQINRLKQSELPKPNSKTYRIRDIDLTHLKKVYLNS